MLTAPPASTEPPNTTVIVDIDERSLKAHGQWPWPRYKIAKLLRKISQMGATTITLDLMFPEIDRTSIEYIKRDISKELNLNIEITGLPTGASNNDTILSDAIYESSAILGYQFLFDGAGDPANCLMHPARVGIMEDESSFKIQNLLIEATDVACNLRMHSQQARGSGFFNVLPDKDGLLRCVPLLMKYDGNIYPSLSLAAIMVATHTNQVVLKNNIDGNYLCLANRAIPLGSDGNFILKFRGKGKTFNYVSATDILSDKISKENIENKFVIIGTSASGLKEFRSTPTDAIFPGVEIHATVIDNFIRGDFISRPYFMRGAEILISLLIGLAFTVIFNRANALFTLFTVILGFLIIWFLSFYVFESHSMLLSPILPTMVLFFNFSFLNLAKFWREERKAKQRALQLGLAQEAIIESMASLTETRDPETGEHIKRTQNYVHSLASELKKKKKYSNYLTSETIDLLYKSAPLHDIGKVGVPDSILLKPGRLTKEEFEEIKKHTIYGRDAIEATERKLGNKSFLKIAHEIAYTHHEKWDGSGYPQGLKGEEIPLSGRLMALADTYDALTSKRVYKPAIPHKEAAQIIIMEKERHFDPEVVEAFIAASENFHKISIKYSDFSEVDDKKNKI